MSCHYPSCMMGGVGCSDKANCEREDRIKFDEAQIFELEQKLARSKTKYAHIRAVLIYLLTQPFDGSWDAQTVYIQKQLAADAAEGV